MEKEGRGEQRTNALSSLSLSFEEKLLSPDLSLLTIHSPAGPATEEATTTAAKKAAASEAAAGFCCCCCLLMMMASLFEVEATATIWCSDLFGTAAAAALTAALDEVAWRGAWSLRREGKGTERGIIEGGRERDRRELR